MVVIPPPSTPPAPPAGPSTSGYDTGGASLRLREEEGYEQARRVRNVIEHLRRGCAAYKPLVIVVANSGVPEEVKHGVDKNERTQALFVRGEIIVICV